MYQPQHFENDTTYPEEKVEHKHQVFDALQSTHGSELKI